METNQEWMGRVDLRKEEPTEPRANAFGFRIAARNSSKQNHPAS